MGDNAEIRREAQKREDRSSENRTHSERARHPGATEAKF
jgi:hypothetical protein